MTILSCKNSDNENNLSQGEIDITTNENKLDSASKKIKIQNNQIESDSELNDNIIYCENKDFIIKVDNLTNDDLRYSSWNKPKTINDEPDLVLYDGIVEQQGTGGGYHYSFKNDYWKYIVENNYMGETEESMGIFIKVLKNDERKLYSKMTDLTIKKNYDLKKYTIKNLVGNWWTLHYAFRKISFYDNGTFIFDNGDGEILKGDFKFNDKLVSLKFKNGLDKILEIGGGKGNTSLTLIGDGENFVKNWVE